MRQFSRVKMRIEFSSLLAFGNNLEDEFKIAPALRRIDALGRDFFRSGKNRRKKEPQQAFVMLRKRKQGPSAVDQLPFARFLPSRAFLHETKGLVVSVIEDGAEQPRFTVKIVVKSRFGEAGSAKDVEDRGAGVALAREFRNRG